MYRIRRKRVNFRRCMDFSLFMMPLHIPSENPSLAFKRDLDLIKYAEDLGFDEFWVGEHHSAGWETIPSPEMFLSAASQITSKIKLGTSMISLPFHHPFHVAERIAFLDHMTEGRALFGIGRCSLPTDIKLFQIPYQDLQPMMEESLEIITLLLESDDPVSYKGKYWAINNMLLQLKSYQRPRMPIAIACSGSEKSLEFAGSKGLKALSLAKPPGPKSVPLSKQWKVMSDAAKRSGSRIHRKEWELVTYVYLSDSKKKAMEEIESGAHRDIHEYFSIISDGGIQNYKSSNTQSDQDVTVSSVIDNRSWIIGTPDDAIEEIEKLNKEAGGIGGLMITTHEWVSEQKSRYSAELFARYVMPHFRGHSKDLQNAWDRTKQDSKDGKLAHASGKKGENPFKKDHKSNLSTEK